MNIDRLPPHDIDSEESLLGSILIDDSCLDKVFIEPGDFFREHNGWIFQAMKDVRKNAGQIDQVTLAHELIRKNQFEECGGAAYINHLIAAVPTSLHAVYYANIIRELSCKRHLISLASRVEALAYGENSSQDILETLDKGHSTIAMKLPDKGYDNAHELANYALERYADMRNKNSVLIPTYLPRLPDRFHEGDGNHEYSVDEAIGGLGEGNLIIIGARPGVGKTQIIDEMALLQSGKPYNLGVLFFSLEMPKPDMIDRTIPTILAGINPLRIYLNRMNDNDEFALQKAIGEFSEHKYFLYRKPFATISDIKQKVIQVVNSEEVKVVYIDYLQLIQSPEHQKPYERVTHITRELKLLAMKVGIPIVVTSQLNREPEYSKDKRPQASELRESGSIEQDADKVFLLHREDKYDPEVNPGIVEFIIAKDRQTGFTGTIKLYYNRDKRRFSDE